ncbi:MAG: hypothetical protein QOD81_1547 [Solirubrobacteraceae bacterium]|jgi:serine/threonine-protein kinase RsbW|nr:hypothetical protein [Solirubrobacteraceae bacterium]
MDPPRLVLQFPAVADQVPPARHTVRAYAAQHGACDPHAVALALSEAVSNAVLHAYADAPEPGDVEVVAQRFADDGLKVVVCDAGSGMKPRPDSPGLGAGLALIGALADGVRVEARPGGGTRVAMSFAAA